MISQPDIAIVGMSGIFPGAADVQSFWHNIQHKKDAIQPVPAHRMDALFFDAQQSVVDRFYCNRGGFIDEFATFDPVPFGILPLAVEGTEPEHLLTLGLAKKALEDASMAADDALLEQTAIIIGKGNYPGPGATRAIEIVRTGEQLLQILKSILPGATEDEMERIKREFQQKKGRFAADTAMGLIPNLVASLVANRLNLGGSAYTLDAACASSLLAVDHAVYELRSGRADAVIAGGVHVSQNAPFWSIFTQLGALSRSQQIRPFDRRADGLLIGEGCGFVVLRRLEDAIQAGQRIYAVIKGVGVASDGAGNSVMSPSVKGQKKAITMAWKQAGLDPLETGYIEAHGTATPLGDKTELETLNSLFSRRAGRPKAGIGSVKSMIGHAMPAAGIAGLIKMAMALYHGKLPPTLHCEEPLPAFKDSFFEPMSELRDWRDSGLSLTAGINAFGFGGINAHVILEAYADPAFSTGMLKPSDVTEELPIKPRLLARRSLDELVRALEDKETDTGDGDFRIALFDSSPERLKRAIKIVQKGRPWRNKQDIWFTTQPLLKGGGKLAFLFPGLDGLAAGEMESVATYFKLPWTAKAVKTPNERVFDLGVDLLEKSKLMDEALKKLGIVPDLNAGHSLGEWLAGRSSGLATEASVSRLLQELNPALFERDDTRFLAVGAGLSVLEPLLAAASDIYLAIDNCPQQVILCGTWEAMEAFSAILRQKQIFHQVMPFRSGFHSPFMRDKLDVLLAGLEKMEFRKTEIPLWSATTLTTYPEEVEKIRQLSVEHLINPVRFRELILKLYEQEGVRCFIQVGSGGLMGFVDDSLKGYEYSAVAANVPIRPGLEQLKRVVAALFVEGKVTGLHLLGLSSTDEGPKQMPVKLQLGSPFVNQLDSLKKWTGKLPHKMVSEPVLQEGVSSSLLTAFMHNCAEVAALQKEVIGQFNLQQTGQQPAPPEKWLDISLDNAPYLIDHSLVRQKPGWHCVDDMDPVIPMTMILELFADMAASQDPGRRVVKMLQTKVFKWLNVADPFRQFLYAKQEAVNQWRLKLDGFAGAVVEMATAWGVAPEFSRNLGESLPVKISPDTIYRHHLFHGPAYQGIRQVTLVAAKGIVGLIEDAGGKGALLDNAGQLFGLWLQLTLKKDKVAFPVKIEEVAFYADYRDQQGLFTCTCRLTSLTDEFATADMLLERNGSVWAVVRGWQNRRLEIDDPLWKISMDPVHNKLSEEIAPGVCFFYQAYQRVVSWDFIVKRYFNQQEKAAIRAMPLNKQKEHIISRVAAKDALRIVLQESRGEVCYPIEFEINADRVGRPVVVGLPAMEGMEVSLAHKQQAAVAIARRGAPVGIDLEEIKDRGEGFASLVFTPEERTLLTGLDSAEWTTRFWVAKEAYGKMLGLGLKGNPKAYIVSDIQGEDIRIHETIIRTINYKNYIIGWTL